jgi:hypothetical protein
MNRKLALVAAIALAACKPSPMLKATVDFSAASTRTLDEVSHAPSVVVDLCRLTAELDYYEHSGTSMKTDYHGFFEVEVAQVDGTTTSWRQICTQYRVAGDGFTKGLEALAAYAEALGRVAGDEDASAIELDGLAASVAGVSGELSGQAVAYKSAVEGLGGPLSELATMFANHWKAKKVRALVAKADPPFQSAICQLLDFLEVAREQQLSFARRDLADWVEDQASAFSTRSPAPSLYAVAMIDADLTRRLDRMDRKLAHLSELLRELGKAHATLAKGWADDKAKAQSIKDLVHLSKDLYAAAKRFQNPDEEVAP